MSNSSLLDRLPNADRGFYDQRQENSIMSGTVRLHRVLRTPPEKIYRAFLEPDAVARWLPPNGFTCKVHELNAKVSGTYKMSFTNFSTGHGHSFGGAYLELVSGS